MKKSTLFSFFGFVLLIQLSGCSREKEIDRKEAEKTTTSPKSQSTSSQLETLDKALTEAKATQKNCLIYFSCYACVNARKFEDQLLKDSTIQKTIQQHFIYKIAYVDDRNKFPDGSSKGTTYAKLQLEKFKSSSQPTLYILSPDGKIIASWSYEDEANTFQRFLEKGIKK